MTGRTIMTGMSLKPADGHGRDLPVWLTSRHRETSVDGEDGPGDEAVLH
jgi:hypothetical protein